MISVDLKNVEKVGQKLRTASTPYYYLIASGNVPNHIIRRITGYCSSVGTASTDIWTGGTATIPLPTTAITLEAIGAAADTFAGAGAQVIEVYGLDSNYNQISEAVQMNGAAAVALVNSYLRINSVHVEQVGANGIATGPINIRATGAGAIYAQIPAGSNSSLSSMFTIPANHYGYIVGWSAGATSKVTQVFLRATVGFEDHKLMPGVFTFQDVVLVADSTTNRTLQLPIKLPPKCDLKVSGQARLAGAQVSTSVELFYEALK